MASPEVCFSSAVDKFFLVLAAVGFRTCCKAAKLERCWELSQHQGLRHLTFESVPGPPASDTSVISELGLGSAAFSLWMLGAPLVFLESLGGLRVHSPGTSTHTCPSLF